MIFFVVVLVVVVRGRGGGAFPVLPDISSGLCR